MTNSDINAAKLATIFSLYRISKETIKVVVFHWRSPDHRVNDGKLTISHLCYTFHVSSQSQTRVKLNRDTPKSAGFRRSNSDAHECSPVTAGTDFNNIYGGGCQGESVVGTAMRARLQGGGSGGVIVFDLLSPTVVVRLGFVGGFPTASRLRLLIWLVGVGSSARSIQFGPTSAVAILVHARFHRVPENKGCSVMGCCEVLLLAHQLDRAPTTIAPTVQLSTPKCALTSSLIMLYLCTLRSWCSCMSVPVSQGTATSRTCAAFPLIRMRFLVCGHFCEMCAAVSRLPVECPQCLHSNTAGLWGVLPLHFWERVSITPKRSLSPVMKSRLRIPLSPLSQELPTGLFLNVGRQLPWYVSVSSAISAQSSCRFPSSTHLCGCRNGEVLKCGVQGFLVLWHAGNGL
ncbi:Nucleoporin [Trichinella spiralis]|uniref:Nucleoporin n=1 Tax=Trichinella spiralis TaxID=6334 RepID=A0ABR3KFX4_TRISP